MKVEVIAAERAEKHYYLLMHGFNFKVNYNLPNLLKKQ